MTTQKEFDLSGSVIFAIIVLAVLTFFYFMGDSTKQENIVGGIDASAKIAVITTNQGVIELELNAQKTPNTVANFVKLAGEGFYNGTRFHRVIKDFMIQGGDPLSKDISKSSMWGTGGPGYAFEDEINADNHNNLGTIAMANSGPNTNGSQFFINVADNNFLDDKHTVFGKVVKGMDIVMKISETKTGANDKPVEDVVIQMVEIK